jgi:hypothetical protein
MGHLQKAESRLSAFVAVTARHGPDAERSRGGHKHRPDALQPRGIVGTAEHEDGYSQRHDEE